MNNEDIKSDLLRLRMVTLRRWPSRYLQLTSGTPSPYPIMYPVTAPPSSGGCQLTSTVSGWITRVRTDVGCPGKTDHTRDTGIYYAACKNEQGRCHGVDWWTCPPPAPLARGWSWDWCRPGEFFGGWEGSSHVWSLTRFPTLIRGSACCPPDLARQVLKQHTLSIHATFWTQNHTHTRAPKSRFFLSSCGNTLAYVQTDRHINVPLCWQLRPLHRSDARRHARLNRHHFLASQYITLTVGHVLL